MQAIATGVPEAIQVSKLIAADALDIPLNKPPGVSGPSKLLFAGRPGETFSLGSINFTLIGPTDEELKKLRDGWIHWLRNSKERLRKIRSELKKRVDEFSTGALKDSPFDLREWEGIPDHEGVSVPNIASLMFLVEESGKQLLLTGDGQQDFILDGLKRTGFHRYHRATLRYFARLWFEPDDHQPSSFHWICDHLELDASWLRRRVFEMADRKTTVSMHLFTSTLKKRTDRTPDHAGRFENSDLAHSSLWN